MQKQNLLLPLDLLALKRREEQGREGSQNLDECFDDGEVEWEHSVLVARPEIECHELCWHDDSVWEGVEDGSEYLVAERHEQPMKGTVSDGACT